MTPYKCRVSHKPPETYGDCLRACVATVFDVKDIDEVPHFYHDGCDGDTGRARMDEWLLARGYRSMYIGYDGSALPILDDVLHNMHEINPNVTYILYGRNDSGDHAVVCKGDKVVNNPAWQYGGLIGPTSQGYWIVVTFVRA